MIKRKTKVWRPGSYARVVVHQAENCWAGVGQLIQLDERYNGFRTLGDASPAFYFHGVLPNGETDPDYSGSANYIPTSALESWEPGEGVAATEADVIERLNAMTGDDPERDHSDADDLLLSLVSPAVRNAYEALVQRAGWWATA